ncbi:unnamed protein product [Pedinophyceae sp. YPF-701]|nr:unnamed protein product [Pedinophyceae sp. YPF-701]
MVRPTPEGGHQGLEGSMQRVKVYRLNEYGQWDDKGTGHVSLQFFQAAGAHGLVVVGDDCKELLLHRIAGEEVYQKQSDSIITWTDQDVGIDIALSFQEPMGCQAVWDSIASVHRRRSGADRDAPPSQQPIGLSQPGMHQRAPHGLDDYGGLLSPSGDMDLDGFGGHPAADLPQQPELGNLGDVARVLSELSPFARERVASKLVHGGWPSRVLDLFHQCEDLEDAEGLANCARVVRAMIMLNDSRLLDVLLRPACIMDVVGALEWDPEGGVRQRHRKYLEEEVVFKEVVPIRDEETRARIHQTYRIGYIKDVILPRALDDAVFASLSSLILFNNVEVVTALAEDSNFLPELFERLKSVDKASPEWEDLVAFLQELCALSKHLQAGTRGKLFASLQALGLFQVLGEVMRGSGLGPRLKATDIMMSCTGSDPLPLRNHLISLEGRGLLSSLVDCLTHGDEGGLQEQVLDLVRVLLDPETMESSDATKSQFLDVFYDLHMQKLIWTLSGHPCGKEEAGTVSASTMGLIVDLLCFCVQQHTYRMKYYILRNNVVEKVMRHLLKRRERWLVLAAVRFVRSVVGLKDEFYLRYITRNNLLEPLVELFLQNGERYNLLNSAILELFDFIRKENIKTLLMHIGQTFLPQLEQVSYVETFTQLRNKLEQLNYTESRTAPGQGAPADAALALERRRRDDRALDKDEEDYFEGGDDEPAGGEGARLVTPAGLVDYPDDDEQLVDDGRSMPVRGLDAHEMRRGAEDGDNDMNAKRLRP